jgi:hypothetical protein
MTARSKSKISPTSATTIAHDFHAVYQKTIREVLLVNKTAASRVLYLRPSQMPFCPVGFFVRHATEGLNTKLDMLGGFYTSVGTTVHEVMQDYLCKSGRFLADYYCAECETWHRMTTVHECCEFDTKYHEIKIDYKGITGHIDAVYIDKQGRLWILDFKTTSVKTAPKKQKDPGVTYLEQIETYAVLFELQYGKKIEGIMDAFIVRDDPKANPVMFARRLTDERRRLVIARLKKYKKMHKRTLDVATLDEALALIEYGACADPYCKVCKYDDDKLKATVTRAYKVGKAAKNVPIRTMAQRAQSK